MIWQAGIQSFGGAIMQVNEINWESTGCCRDQLQRVPYPVEVRSADWLRDALKLVPTERAARFAAAFDD